MPNVSRVIKEIHKGQCHRTLLSSGEGDWRTSLSVVNVGSELTLPRLFSRLYMCESSVSLNKLLWQKLSKV